MSLVRWRVRLARNWQDLVFPWRMEAHHAAEVVRRAESALGGKARRVSDLDPAELAAMVESRVVSKELVEAPHGHFLAGEGWSVLLNEEDHVRIQVFSGTGPRLDADEVTALALQAFELSDQLEREGPWAWDEQMGFLTACPSNCGSGMRVSALLHLPAATVDPAPFQRAVSMWPGMALRGAYGEGSSPLGYLFQVSSSIPMQAPQVQIEQAVLAVSSVLAAEREVLERVSSDPRVQDACWRALGVLQHARLLELQEAMHLLGFLRLGQQLGLYRVLPDPEIWSLMIQVMPAHLARASGEVPEEEARASMIRARIKGGEEGR